jgi:hypothetical protein
MQVNVLVPTRTTRSTYKLLHLSQPMESEDDDLYGADEPGGSNGVPQDAGPSAGNKTEAMEDGEEEGEEVEEEDSDDVSHALRPRRDAAIQLC